MTCQEGSALLRTYEAAVLDRNVARDILLVSSVRKFPPQDPPFDDLMFVAKQKYSDAFVAWVTHKESCPVCKALLESSEQTEFASV